MPENSKNKQFGSDGRNFAVVCEIDCGVFLDLPPLSTTQEKEESTWTLGINLEGLNLEEIESKDILAVSENNSKNDPRGIQRIVTFRADVIANVRDVNSRLEFRRISGGWISCRKCAVRLVAMMK
ncbi:hypothetical protein HK100_003501, partial [Physocladia obscura]